MHIRIVLGMLVSWCLLALPIVTAAAGQPAVKIVINIAACTLGVYQQDVLQKEYPVAVGSMKNPTPVGEFTIISKEENPTWVFPAEDKVIQSGPDNPLGYRWLGFYELYGIHGTNVPGSIGKAVSRGCVRMLEKDVEEIFPLIAIGAPVRILYEPVSLQLAQTGEVRLRLYDDWYQRGGLTLEAIKQRLAEQGLQGLYDQAVIGGMLRTKPKSDTVLGRTYRVQVDGEVLPIRAVEFTGQVWVPVWSVAAVLYKDIYWDEAKQCVRLKGQQVPGVVRGDVVYIEAENIIVLFGGRQFVDRSAGIWSYESS